VNVTFVFIEQFVQVHWSLLGDLFLLDLCWLSGVLGKAFRQENGLSIPLLAWAAVLLASYSRNRVHLDKDLGVLCD
jgi:hypothetical protein